MIMPSGIIPLASIVKTEITLPIKTGSTVVCSKTIDVVLNNGNAAPINAIIRRYNQKEGTSPNPADNNPHKAQESVIV